MFDLCGKEESMDHILFYCVHYSKARADYGIDRCDPDNPTVTQRGLLFSKGTGRKHQELQSLVLQFLGVTDLIDRV